MALAGGASFTDLTLSFDDDAAALPGTSLASGTFLPRKAARTFAYFAPPAPGLPHANGLSLFDGTNPNGTWGLYGRDRLPGDTGALRRRSLSITAGGATPIPLPPAGWLLLSGLALLALRRRRA